MIENSRPESVIHVSPKQNKKKKSKFLFLSFVNLRIVLSSLFVFLTCIFLFFVFYVKTSLCLCLRQSEPNCDVVAFHRHMIPLDVFKDPSRTLEQVISSACCYGSQATDCSKPMLWASKHNKEYDAFIIYTSSQTNIHKVPPYAALEAYRQKMNIPTAKLIVVAMTALEATIARPDDMHVLDVVGFDPDTPDMIREFLMGELD